MTTIRFEPSGVECEVDAPARMIDVADDNPDVGVPFSCRSATCGTCRVSLQLGGEAMGPIGQDEAEVLAIFGDEPGTRLCCQLLLVEPIPKVVLRVIDD